VSASHNAHNDPMSNVKCDWKVGKTDLSYLTEYAVANAPGRAKESVKAKMDAASNIDKVFEYKRLAS